METPDLPINVKSPNNISKWQMGFNSAFKGLRVRALGFCSISSALLGATLGAQWYSAS
jgi:hypothetical protein